jgi:2-keto-4-pentenoate hydratase
MDSGAEHVGWKVALGMPGAYELTGDSPLVGYLTTATQIPSGSIFAPDGIDLLQVDCELAVELAGDVEASSDAGAIRIAGVAAALELCDVAGTPDEFEEIVAANVFHRRFVLGPFQPPPQGETFAGVVHVNGAPRNDGTVSDVPRRLTRIARLLEALGESVRAGDRIICGAICSELLAPGDDVEVEVEGLGACNVSIEAIADATNRVA